MTYREKYLYQLEVYKIQKEFIEIEIRDKNTQLNQIERDINRITILLNQTR